MNADDANADERKELAARLGITLGPTQPDEIDNLTFSPGQISEENLAITFGLADTTAPLAAPIDSLLKRWRIAYVRANWIQDDHRPGRSDRRPIIEPDVVIAEDILTRKEGAPAYDLWVDRRRWLEERQAEFEQLRQGHATDLAAIEAILVRHTRRIGRRTGSATQGGD